jgi:2-dehydro-3-deoxyphosphooctonate aldolase (KDO 8-P synthase)
MTNPTTKTVQIGDVAVGGGNPLALLAGPCVIEDPARTLRIGQEIQKITQRLGMPYIFKASFDKANRSSYQAFRGPGITEGLRILGDIKQALRVPVVSDIHEANQASVAAEVLDIIQVPAFLCRQTDLLHEAALTGLPVNVKKGQFLSPAEMKNVVNKLEQSGCHSILLTERGSSFGYNNLVVDMRSLGIMRSFGYPVVFDATHSVQLPGGGGDHSAGQREFAPILARAAAATGIDALFLEVHDNPSEALSDGPNMIPLEELEQVLLQVLAIDATYRRLQ